MNLNTLAIVLSQASLDQLNKTDTLPVGQGAIYSVVAILMVFVILLVIIGITTLVFKLNGLFDMKKELDKAKQNSTSATPVAAEPKTVAITDDDMMAAVLVATIDYRNEVKKDVRVVSVKEVK